MSAFWVFLRVYALLTYIFSDRSTATAARVVNAIPALCAANAGVLSALDLVVAAQAAWSYGYGDEAFTRLTAG